VIWLLVSCASTGGDPPVAAAPSAVVDGGYVLLHTSTPLFQRPDTEAHRGRLGRARSEDFPAELWSARVLAESEDWLRVAPVARARSAAHWADPPAVFQALGLAVWIPAEAALDVVTEPFVQGWPDGSNAALGPGTPVLEGQALVRAGEVRIAVSLHVPPESRGRRYRPGPAEVPPRPAGWLAVDQQLGFGRVGGEVLARVPRAGVQGPATRVPLVEVVQQGETTWGVLGSRTAQVRTILDPERLRDGAGWSAARTRAVVADSWEGWWVVSEGAEVRWVDGTPAGRVRSRVRFDVRPQPGQQGLCVWWQDLAGRLEPLGATARWSAHASVLGERGLQLCFDTDAVQHEVPPER